MRRRSLSIIILLLLTQPAWAQSDSIGSGHVELVGTITYSMSAFSQVNWYTDDYRTDSWTVAPGVGVFVYDRMQIGFDIRYQRTREEIDYGFYGSRPGHSTRSSVAILVGPGYNFPVREGVWMFLNAKVGLYWEGSDAWMSWTTVETPLVWSERYLILPVLQGGFKVFLGNQVAVVIQAEYNRVPRLGLRNVLMGLGIAAYL